MEKTAEKTAAKRQKNAANKPKTAAKSDKIRITFVCTGNTCRSAMAERIFKEEIARRGLKDKFAINSYGLRVKPQDEINPKAVEALKSLGYRAAKHKAKPLTLAAAKKSDLIVCMTARHKAEINLEKCYTVGDITGGGDVADPFGAPVSEYVRAAKYLAYSVDETLELAEKTAANRRSNNDNKVGAKPRKGDN